MATLTAQQIAAVKACKLVPVPEWGGDVYLRLLGAEEIVAVRELFGDHDAKPPREQVAALCSYLGLVLCDEGCMPLFADAAAAVAVLKDRSHVVLMRLVQEAHDYNGLSEAAREAAKKNYEGGETSAAT